MEKKDRLDYSIWLGKNGYTLKDKSGKKVKFSTALADYEHEKWVEEIKGDMK